jgi:hypothetical protein
MKQILLLLTPLFCLSLKAQQLKPDARLYAVFDSAYLENLQTDNPTLLLRWNFYLDNAFIITDFPPKKGNIEQFPAVRIPDLGAINILALERNQRLTRDWQKPVFYRLEGADKVLMYFSGKDFNQKFQDWLAVRRAGED